MNDYLSPQLFVSLFTLFAVLLVMLAEQRYSLANERALRERGATEPPDDVYPIMRLTYPIAFVAMAIEGALSDRPPGVLTVIGAAIFIMAKALKYWAISSLGPRWTFRVLVPPEASLVTTGPYTVLRHPNYIGVMGELIGMATLVGAPVSGSVSTIVFAVILWQRTRVENDALRHPPCT